jgi:hypothetical protein
MGIDVIDARGEWSCLREHDSLRMGKLMPLIRRVMLAALLSGTTALAQTAPAPARRRRRRRRSCFSAIASVLALA